MAKDCMLCWPWDFEKERCDYDDENIMPPCEDDEWKPGNLIESPEIHE